MVVSHWPLPARRMYVLTCLPRPPLLPLKVKDDDEELRQAVSTIIDLQDPQRKYLGR